MAINNEYIININAEQATKNTRSLKQEIKELKDRLYELEEGTDEYNDTMQKLANKMFIVKETQEQATLAMQDWGQYLSNGLRAMNGAIGAVQAYTSAMSLLGVEVDDNNVLMNKLVQSMALLQGVSAIEESIDAFTRLGKTITSAGGAIGVLKKALNGLKSHPVILALSALTVAGTALYSYTNKKEEEREETYKNNQIQRATNFVGKNIPFEETKEYLELLKQEATTYDILTKKQKYYETQLKEFRGNKPFYIDENNKDIIEKEEQRLAVLIAQIAKEKEIQGINDTNARKAEERAKAESAYAEKVAQRIAEEEEWQNSLADIYTKNKNKTETDYLSGIISEVEYKERLLKINEQELNDTIKIYEEKGKNYKLTKEYGDKRIKQIKDEIELEQLKVKIEKEQAEQRFKDKESDNELFNKQSTLEVDNQYLSKLSEIDFSKSIAEQLISIEEWKQDELYRIQKAGIEQQFALLQEKKDKGLISEREYAEGIVDIAKEETALEEQESKRRIEIKQREAEEQDAVNDLIKQQQQELISAVGSILGGIADNLSEETETYKHIKASEAIINTLSAVVATFTGITSTTKGWGIALAVAKAAGVLASGMSTVKQIYAVNTSGAKNSTNYSLSNGANSTINRNYSNTTLTNSAGAEINIGDEITRGIGNIRVIVSANEITDKQNQIKKVQVSNEF